MATLVVGKQIYSVPNTPDIRYTISHLAFIGVRKEIKDEIVTVDFAGLLFRGHEFIKNLSSFPKTFNDASVRDDVLNGDDKNDWKAQADYLRQTRRDWEDRYSISEYAWFHDFQYFISEINGRVGDEWFRLYSLVRGDIPSDIPVGVFFSCIVYNVFDKWRGRIIRKRIKKFFEDNPDALKQIYRLQIPENLPVWEEIGLTEEDFVEYARREAESKISSK